MSNVVKLVDKKPNIEDLIETIKNLKDVKSLLFIAEHKEADKTTFGFSNMTPKDIIYNLELMKNLEINR